MSEPRGLGGREGADLLMYLADRYIPSLRGQAAAAMLGAWTDDPAGVEDSAAHYFDRERVLGLGGYTSTP